MSLFLILVAIGCDTGEGDCLDDGGLAIETADGTRCAPATADGGKPCAGGDECEGFCNATEPVPEGTTGVTGSCSEHTEELCSQPIEDAVAGKRLCI